MPGKAPATHQQRQLLSCQDIPPVMRIPFILHGYRRLYQPWIFYLRSLLTIHNETLNVWTHLMGGVLIALEGRSVVAQFAEKWPMETQMASFYATCALLTHLFSCLTHLLHSRSCKVHMFVFFCDYASIGVSALAISLCVFCFCSLPDYAALLKPFFLPLSAINSFLTSSVFCYVFATRRRRYTHLARVSMFLPICTYYLWTCGNFFHKLYLRHKVNPEDVDLKLNHLSHLLLLLGAFFFYITRLPERLFPGNFDICGQSHQLFHCGVTFAQWSVLRAIHQDLERNSPLLYSRQSEPIPMSQVWFTLGIVIALNAATLVILQRKFCHDETSFFDVKKKEG